MGRVHYAWATGGHAQWSYEGETGPDAWAHIEMGGTNQCAMSRQSPIDIEPLMTKYDKTLRPLELRGHDKVTPNIIVINNGHTIQLNSKDWSQRLSGGPLSGEYKLLQMHFHWGKDSYRGSEHTVNGKRYPIELHMVHVATNSTNGKLDYPGAIAVLGIFFDVTKGSSNMGVQKIARLIKGMETDQKLDMTSELSPSMLQPSIKDFFTYEGSLTTPPCSQIVTWLVAREPLKITETELGAFRSTLFVDRNPMVDNFRPVQPLNSREVRSSFMTGSSANLASSILVVLFPILLLARWQ
ncbi:carbonic anhydrase 7-like [Tropilaelaps mercedesae]|uniref:Carbonic anhydrase n=1 Tax=Tropilaelaps mercedesae TaxID=418985 RepID=A0A1V9XCN0_9ACAR|nr:carbonic anhydrase 7-like [Tropilaelaps mercedesae]